MGWSTDGRIMYFTNSSTVNVYTYRFEPATGDISDRNHLSCSRERGGSGWFYNGYGGKLVGRALWGVESVENRSLGLGKRIGEIKMPTRMIICPGIFGESLCNVG